MATKSTQQKNDEIWQRLEAGEAVSDLIAAGFPSNTVYRTQRAIGKGELSPQAKREAKIVPAGKQPSTIPPKDVSATVARLTQEQIILPNGMFILYDFIKAQEPNYQATKSEWIQDVVRCWAEDHADEIGLNPMMWVRQGQEPNEDESDELEEEELDGTAALDAGVFAGTFAEE